MDPTVSCDRNASGIALLILNALALVISVTIIPLRVYIRLRLVRAFGWDDAVLIAAFLVAVAADAVAFRLTYLGLGRHIECVPVEDALELGKLIYVSLGLLIISSALSRTSVALFVIRLFAITNRMKMILLGFTAFMALSLSICVILVYVSCSPVEALWNPALQPYARCWSSAAMAFAPYYNGAVSIVSDLILALLPVYFLRKLQMPRKRQLGLMALMTAGLIPSACAIARTATSANQKTDDPTYSNAILCVFAYLETNLLLIAATVPALPPIFTRKSSKSSYIHSGDSGQGRLFNPSVPATPRRDGEYEALPPDSAGQQPLMPLNKFDTTKSQRT